MPPVLPLDSPIVLLIDRGTASSAELFAAALRDNGRGVLLGEASFGKSLIQRVFPMPNGGALKLTIGEFLTPSHGRIKPGVGLSPDAGCTTRVAKTSAERATDVCVEKAAILARSRESRTLPPALRRE